MTKIPCGGFKLDNNFLNMNENDFAQSNSSLALKLETDKELNASFKKFSIFNC